jgi:hypothetical protein
MTHTLSRVLGAAALAASLATAGTAGAAQQHRPLDTRTDPTPSYRMVEPTSDEAPPSLAGPSRRAIFSEVVWRDSRLYLRGDVESWFRRDVTVQRRGCDACKWRRYDVVSTGRRGWFRSVINAPQDGSTFWRAKVRAADGYARSYSATWETYY